MCVKADDDGKKARALLMDPHKIKREPVLAQEARRETARESIRRAEYERRREDADKALLMRNLRILGSANAAEEKESLRQGKMQQREKLLALVKEWGKKANEHNNIM